MFSKGYGHFLLSNVICLCCLAKAMAIYLCPMSFAYVQQWLSPFTFVQCHLHMFSNGHRHLRLPKVICICLAKVMAIYVCPKSFAYVQQRLWTFIYVRAKSFAYVQQRLWTFIYFAWTKWRFAYMFSKGYATIQF